MTRADNERVAILEIEMKHMQEALAAHRSESADAIAKANTKLDRIEIAITAWENQARGGKWVLGFLVTIGGTIGGGLVWLAKTMSFFGGLPR